MRFMIKKMFKEVFKQFKSKNKTQQLATAYNFSSDTISSENVRPYCTETAQLEKLKHLRYFGLKAPEEWNIYEITEKPGLIFIQNPFTSLGQRYWITKCLRDYSKKPNKSNLDAFDDLPKDKNWWDACNISKNTKLLEKMRWITLGYHHNWDTKIYSEESKDPFPKDLGEMCEFFANVLGFTQFTSEAAIVNYYHMDSTLSGHTDHSEPNLNAPLFSLSFGQTAIFLVGGLTKEEKPIALFVNSGDVVVMSKESRQCYHAVPCIIKGASTPWVQDGDCNKDYFLDEVTDKQLVNDCRSDEFWEPFDQYLQTSRININVRQVLNSGQDCL